MAWTDKDSVGHPAPQVIVMVPFTLLSPYLALVAAIAPSSAVLQEGGTSSITVLGQEEDAVILVVQSQEAKLTTLRIEDGLEVEDTRVPANTEHTHYYRLQQRNDPLGLRPLTISLLDEFENLIVATNTVAVEPLELPDEPCLTITPSEIVDLQKRWGRDRRTSHELDKLQNRCDNQLLNNLEVPATGGAWTQLYRCPDTQVYLQMITYTLHRSPATGKEYSGDFTQLTAIPSKSHLAGFFPVGLMERSGICPTGKSSKFRRS